MTTQEELDAKLEELKKSLDELIKGELIPFKPKQKTTKPTDDPEWASLPKDEKIKRMLESQTNNPYRETAPSKAFQPATGPAVDPRYNKAKPSAKVNVRQGTPEEIAAMNAQRSGPPPAKPSTQPIKYPGIDMQHDPKTNQTHISLQDDEGGHFFTVDHKSKTIKPWISNPERGKELNLKFQKNEHLKRLFPDHKFEDTFD